MNQALADFVRRRAGDCCEYCRLPQAFTPARFQIDPIIAEQHGGLTVASNLALACLADNNYKGPTWPASTPEAVKKAQFSFMGSHDHEGTAAA